MPYREPPPKLRCYCECTGDVHLLAAGEACPGEGRVLTGFSTEETIAIVCGRTDHAPLEDQTLCGKYAGHGEHCVKPVDHDGDCVADWQIEKAMLTVRRSCRRARKAFDFDDERFTVLPGGVKKYHVRCPYCGAHGRDDGHHLVIDPNACGAYTKAGWPCDLIANHSGPCGSDAEVAQYMVRDGRRMPGEFE